MTRRAAVAVMRAGALALLVHASVAMAADAPPVDRPPVWASLSPQQQSVLAPLKRDWATIEGDRKQKWLEVARRFPSLPAAEQQRIQQRMIEWARMTPAERGRARLQFQQARQWSPEDRQARWEAYQSLPDDQRRALAQRAKPASAPANGKPAAEARLADTSAKRNIVPSVRPSTVKAVAPTVVQAKPGATTTLMTQKDPPPSHQQPGLPKIAATQGFVDPRTLLPQRGPQAADIATPPRANRPAGQ